MWSGLIAYADRNNYPAARLSGLEEDLGMDQESNQFQVGLSVLFVGYVSVERIEALLESCLLL